MSPVSGAEVDMRNRPISRVTPSGFVERRQPPRRRRSPGIEPRVARGRAPRPAAASQRGCSEQAECVCRDSSEPVRKIRDGSSR
jgi:hypothetical protein